MKLTSKINLLFTIIVSCILLVMAIIVYNITRQKVKDDFYLRLQGRGRNSANLYLTFKEDTASLMKTLGASLTGTLINKNIDIYNNENKLVYEFHDASTAALYPDTASLQRAREKVDVFYPHKEKDVYLYHYSKDGIEFTVAVAAENITGREYLSNLERIFLFTCR